MAAAELRHGEPVVVVGAGFIGTEVVHRARSLGCPSLVAIGLSGIGARVCHWTTGWPNSPHLAGGAIGIAVVAGAGGGPACSPHRGDRSRPRTLDYKAIRKRI
jgi:hypothetical protein